MIKLTEFARGGGCGCKIAPAVLQEMLGGLVQSTSGNLLVGNDRNDDAAAWDLGNDQVLLSTTDFFLPIVDDPSQFGQIAAANALSDIYAMGGKPLFALAILGWPVDKLPASLASQVLHGASAVAAQAGIPIAGGHTIDAAEPFFGLAVNGMVARKNLRTNGGACPGDRLYLTKALGTGMITTAAKRGIPEMDIPLQAAIESMLELNQCGALLSALPGVHAMTDVTGFGLAGHALEMARASQCSFEIKMSDLPLLPGVQSLLDRFIYPDMTMRNFNAVKESCTEMKGTSLLLLCDPQTSGGLLFSVAEADAPAAEKLLDAASVRYACMGRVIPQQEHALIWV